MSGRVVVLAGGTGGAKLARGMLDVVGGESLTVIANTGDDIEIYGAYVSPDPDLVTFWLTDRIDERGWGLAGDTFHVMEGLRSIGVGVWFNLGDQDLAICLERARRLQLGERLTEAQQHVARALNTPATVLPMCDQPVRTRVMAGGRWWPFQEYMIKAGGATAGGASAGGALAGAALAGGASAGGASAGANPVEDVEFRGASAATLTPEVAAAITEAQAIIIGPSNPVISISPILAVPGLRTALETTPAPIVAVSPLIAGHAVKGPTEAFMDFAGLPTTSDGIAAYYDKIVDGLIADQRASHIPTLETDVLMDTPEARRRLAEQTLRFASALS